MSYSDLAESASETKEQLVANLRRVVSDAEDLLAATAGQTDTKITELRARARQAAEYTDEYVHDNPWSSIGAAAALGLLIGVLLGRR